MSFYSNWLRKLGGAAAACFVMSSAALSGDGDTGKTLYDFTDARGEETWRAVNDGVMGGLSRGGPTFNASAGNLEFSGELSLENNGGFSSIRTNGPAMDLSRFDGIAVRFRGDGREYLLNLHTDFRIMAGSYRGELPPAGDEWATAYLPFSDFYATSFGRRLSRAPKVNASQIRSLGFMLADKKEGPFKLEVDWIQAYRGAPHEAERDTAASDLVDTALAAGAFKTLAAALEAADLVEALRGPGPFTVFAPTDEAFGKLAFGTLVDLLKPENKASLQRILKYHVVEGRLPAREVVKRNGTRTLLGPVIPFSVQGDTVSVGPAAVVQADVKASNGVIHVIDSVLLPPAAINDSTAASEEGVSPAKCRELIELAIRRGVPLYNHGNAAACAAVYEVAAHGLMGMSADLLSGQNRRRMESTLAGLESVNDMNRKAWALRHLLDEMYEALGEL